MIRNTYSMLVAGLALAAASGCGGKIDALATPDGRSSTVAELEQGATVQRAYLGVDDPVTVGATRVVTSFDLRGGAQVELEVVTPDSSLVRFELWQQHVDGSVTLVMPVDAPSGFALENIDATEDGSWLLTFPSMQPGQVIVHMDCVGGEHGCSRARQPGESCPAGWSCDDGLLCQLPVGVCGALAGAGTCVVPATSCPDGAAPVCSCDGITYPNECAARLAGAAILQHGACAG